MITKILSEEHQHILKLVELLEKECSNPAKEVSDSFFLRVIQFIKKYADQFHHRKEEDILFVELNQKAETMHCNPTYQMLHEHDLGRQMVREMEEGIKTKDKGRVLNGAKGYSQLIKEHIYKEDNILYPMAEETLGEKEKKELSQRFMEADQKNKRLKEEGLEILNELMKVSR